MENKQACWDGVSTLFEKLSEKLTGVFMKPAIALSGLKEDKDAKNVLDVACGKFSLLRTNKREWTHGGISG